MKKIYFLFSISFVFISLFALYKIMFKEQVYYQEQYEDKTTIYTHSISAPRGRILDCNGNVLVDNIGVKTIVYRKEKNITEKEELEIASVLARLLEWNEKITSTELKNYWLRTHKEEAKKLLTEDEYRLYEERKLTSNDLYYLKMDRITKEMLESLSSEEQKTAHVYTLMNKGYSYEPKIIKTDISEKEYARVMEENKKGITSELYYKREYPYGNTLKSIFGSIGAIPKEEEEFYLSKGYSLDDVVGISYLEKQYEEYLKGEKEVYQIQPDGSLLKIKEGTQGNDLILSLDIHMQEGIEEILKKEIKEGKKLLNTDYYNGSYVIIGNPSNGAIKAMVGLKYIKEDVFINVETDILNASFTVGSVVKGASMAMAYQNNLVEVGKKIKDACIKLYLVPEKCSYKSLGMIDDITALKTSSNYYQFLLAIKLAGYKYTPNMKMEVSEKEFSIYRDAFASFGLGVKTGIDLPNEFTGIKGTTIAPDLLLNFAIGQYDTYTPLQLLQYINTIANNGVRYRLRLLDSVKKDNEFLYKPEKEELSSFSLEEQYFNRIKEGFYQVVNLGTGYGYVNPKYYAVGKTGTSESYFDSNLDGLGDVLTITNTFAMYAPKDNPKYSMVVVSPNVNHPNKKSDYFAYINRFISKKVSDYIFNYY